MQGIRRTLGHLASRKARVRSSRPEAEALEGRMLLYSAYGPTAWTYSSRITYSFMPDGTNVGGVPSALFQTLNAIAPTATWQNQIEQAATPWETNANLNLALVPDGGQAFGTSGNQQDDPRFGDIRIGAVPLPSGVLAETLLPPPTNGGTDAGDIFFNSNIQFGINGGIDLQTVAAHEFGHALGLGESTDLNAVMYGTYDGIKTALDSDDIAGIQSIYGAPQYDRFNQGILHNGNFLTATNITSYIDGNGQIALSGLDNTKWSQSEWYAVTVPSTNSGHMVVTAQSSNLSSLAPSLYVYNSTVGQISMVTAPATYGATLSTTISVTAGQKYYIRVMAAAAAGGGYGTVGAYGLELNFGTQYQPPIAPPNTVVAQQPDQNGGSMDNAITAAKGTTSGPAVHSPVGLGTPGVAWTGIGQLSGWAAAYTTSANVTVPTSGWLSPVTVSPDQSLTIAGPIAALPASSSAPVTAAPSGGSQESPSPASDVSTLAAHHRHKRAHHAVDATLSGWAGHRNRPQTSAKIRLAVQKEDRASFAS